MVRRGRRPYAWPMAELRHYRYFVEIARRGSYTAASAALHITQSALSEQILDMERELGCRLFDRGRHGAALTPQGEHLLPRAESLLLAAADIEREAKLSQRSRHDMFRIAVTMSPILSWMPQTLSDLRRRYPRTDFYVEDAATAEIFMRVTAGQVDLGIVSQHTNAQLDLSSTGLISELLVEDDWVVLVSDDHPFAARGAVPLESLRDERHITFPANFSLRLVIDELLSRAGIRVAPVIETGWLEMAIRFVAADLGVCVAPRAVTMLDHGGVSVVEIDNAHLPRRGLIALHRKDSPRLPMVRQLICMAREQLTPVAAKLR